MITKCSVHIRRYLPLALLLVQWIHTNSLYVLDLTIALVWAFRGHVGVTSDSPRIRVVACYSLCRTVCVQLCPGSG